MSEPSPLYTAILQALGVTANSVVATAWGRDYTLMDLENMTPRQRRITNWKLKSYNCWLRVKLQVSRVHIWVLRNTLEFLTGIRMLFGL